MYLLFQKIKSHINFKNNFFAQAATVLTFVGIQLWLAAIKKPPFGGFKAILKN